MSRPHLLFRVAIPAGLLIAAVGGRVAGQAPAATLPGSLPVAASTRPGTGPATGPASGPATRPEYTLDSPRDALKWFAAALRDGDAGRLRKVILTTSGAEDRMVGAIGDMARAFAGLHAAAARQFGPEAAARFTDDAAAQFEQTLVRIDAAEVTVDGDAATVRYAESQDRPYALKRVGTTWLLPATQFSQGAPPEALDRQMAELVVQTRIVNEMAGEIAAGRYKTADAAGQAWRSRMMSALGGQGSGPGKTGPRSPATAPGTTKPRD